MQWVKVINRRSGRVYCLDQSWTTNLTSNAWQKELERYGTLPEDELYVIVYARLDILLKIENKQKSDVVWCSESFGYIDTKEKMSWSQNMDGWKIEGFEE